ncbi:MAG: hypothetical protein LUH21_04110 [Clostridiales bacterium]|nr:hypothetical protein [Clostridiales bacterium]
MTRELNILKAVLLLRKFNKYRSKEARIEETKSNFEKGYMTDESLQEWIDSLKEDLSKSPEQLEKESQKFIESLCDMEAEQARQKMESYEDSKEYGPSNPWDAPGMSISDFI